MRMAMGAFGLVGLLVVLFIVLYMQASHTQTVLTHSRPARDLAEQMSGRDDDGRNVMEAIELEPRLSGQQLRSLTVKRITPGSRIDAYFGLLPGDEIIGAEVEFRGIMDDPELARAQVLSQYQNRRQIIVMRDGQRLTLPPADGVPSPAAPAPAPGGGPVPQLPGGLQVPR
jgi:hypothetical protein